jgi:hypothetical protein
MEFTSLQILNVPKWNIKGFDNYYFDTDNKLVNKITNRVIKKRVKGYSVGYTINGKFRTLKDIKPLLIRIDYNSKDAEVDRLLYQMKGLETENPLLFT